MTNNTTINTGTTSTSISGSTTKTPQEHFERFMTSSTMILIDTCSLLEDSFPAFMEKAIPVLEREGRRILVPLRVTQELVKHMTENNEEKPLLQASAKRALGIINKYNGRYFSIVAEENDPFADALFQTIYITKRQEHRMLFITQDNSLAADLLNMSNCLSVRAKGAIVKRLSAEGYLVNLPLQCENGHFAAPERKPVSASRPSPAQKPEKSNASAEVKKPASSEKPAPVYRPARPMPGASGKPAFQLYEKPTEKTDVIMRTAVIPEEGGTVYARHPEGGSYAEVKLGRCIASGGEGKVYETDGPFVAKIYRKDTLTAFRRDKVIRMADRNLVYPGICFPVMALVDYRLSFVGYLMKKAAGTELRKSAFLPFVMKAHPDWKRADLVQLCVTILKKIEYLHSQNIFIGDINPSNILVASPTEVWFVDTDSYQIEDYPCPVGQCCYTAPEIQGKEYRTFLRTEGNENFAVATLLFQILMGGKSPYSHMGGGDQAENICKMNFPYRLGDNGNRNEPDGPWRFMWSHFPYLVKEAFYHTFQKGGKYADENSRLSAAEWLKVLYSYQYLLREGKLEENDPMSLEMVPTRTKAGRDAKWAVCEKCGESFPYYGSKSGRVPIHCPRCLDTVFKEVKCADCGETFEVLVRDADYCRERGYSLPVRCPSCRRNRQEEAKKREQEAENRRLGGLTFDKTFPEMKPSSSQTPVKSATQPVAPQATAKPAFHPVFQTPVKLAVAQPAPKSLVPKAPMKPVMPQPAPQAPVKPVVQPSAPQAPVKTVMPQPAPQTPVKPDADRLKSWEASLRKEPPRRSRGVEFLKMLFGL